MSSEAALELYSENGSLVFSSNIHKPMQELEIIKPHWDQFLNNGVVRKVEFKVMIPAGGLFLVLGNVFGECEPSPIVYEREFYYRCHPNNQNRNWTKEQWYEYVGMFVVKVG